MKSEITLSKLFPVRLFMSKISFNFLFKILPLKLLFVFCFVLVFSFSQVNFSYAEPRSALTDGKCYTLAGTNGFVDSLGYPILKSQETARCAGNDGGSISPAQIAANRGTTSGAVTKVPCYRNGDGAIVDALTKTKTLSADQCSTVEQGVLSSSTQATAAQIATDNPNNGATGSKNFCSDIKIDGPSSLAKISGCYVVYSFMEVALQINAVFAKLSATMFDTLTQKFVLQISTLFKNDKGADGAFIYGAWSVIRDLANIAAFFGAVYTGFRYITGSDSLDFKKAVTKLILYSILVNFSFPIAKFLIDISNVISLQVYGGITEYKAGAGNLSNMILSRMGAVSMLVSDVGSTATKFPGFSSFSVMFLAIIYLASIFFVFIYASIMIAVRAFILLTCVIFSPLMFLNFAFPKLTELHEKWRENFFGQLMFAPILMVGFWLSFILMSAATTGADALSSLGSASANATGAKEVTDIINMTLSIIALFMTVKIAGSVSGGAGKSISGMVGGGMKGLGLAVATGGTGLLARATVGRAGAMMANSNWVKNTGAQNGASRRMAASLASNAGNKMSNFSVAGVKSFDEKKIGNLKADRDKMNAENGQQIKKTGMSDLIAQAKNPAELKLAQEEMVKRGNANYKPNNDLFGNQAKQKAFELNQSDLKSVKDNNVGFLNQGEYKNELVNKRRLESGTVSKLRDERLKKRDEGRIENLNKAKTEADVEKAFGKIVSSSEKTFDTGKEREEKILPDMITKSENKIESLKNTSLSAALRSKKAYTGPAPAIGSNITAQAVEPVQTKSRVEGAVQKSDREAVK